MIREDELILIGDEAWTPEELARAERDRERKRANDRAYYRRWRERNLERVREINREHMRRKRAGMPRQPAMSDEERRARKLHRGRAWAVGGEYRALQVTASLHGLGCTGPTRKTGCRCQKTLIVREAA